MTSADNSPMSWCIKLNASWDSAGGRDAAGVGLPDSLYAHMRASRVGQGSADAFQVAPQVYEVVRDWMSQIQRREPQLILSEVVVTLTSVTCKPERHTHDENTVLLVVDVAGGSWVVQREFAGAINWK